MIFALVYVAMSEAQADSFNLPVTRITGLYFTVTVFTTVGFGDVVARTDTARAVVTVQMLLDLVLLGGLVRADHRRVPDWPGTAPCGGGTGR